MIRKRTFSIRILVIFCCLFLIGVIKIAAQPVITTFEPKSGPVGTLITIIGTGLSDPTLITIGGNPALMISNNDTTIKVMAMPGNTTSGIITVNTPEGTVLSASGFISSSGYSFSQEGDKLTGSGASGNAMQGCSIAISADGNTTIIGGRYDSLLIGAAWIFTRSGNTWSQQGAKLVGTGALGNAGQGHTVSISADGNTAIVGGAWDNSNIGAAWIYTRTGNIWSQQGDKLVGTGAIGSDVYQGFSVSLSADGNTAIVGGLGDNSNIGAAWIYTRTGNTWSQQGEKLVGFGTISKAGQGYSVSISADGTTAIIGGPYDNSNIGAAWIYTRNGNTWSQQGIKLVGTGYVGTTNQGRAVSISADGNIAVVGGPFDNSTGAAWIYTRELNSWSQQGDKLVGTGAVGFAGQGCSVSLSADGNTVIVGGFGDNYNLGAAWNFKRNGNTWSQWGDKLVGTGAIDSPNQGNCVSLSADGSTLMLGGPFDNSNTGAAWVFSSPRLLVEPSSLFGFTYNSGSGPSESQCFFISGRYLDAIFHIISVSAGTFYEVSLDNNTFNYLVQVSYSSNSLGRTPVYVRLKGGLAVGDYNYDYIQNLGGGASTVIVTSNGTVVEATSIHVASPNGGENWTVGSSHAITWTSLSVTNVKIEYSTDNGSTWAVITPSTAASAGSYAWTIPNTPSTQCLVKISDASNGTLYDVSESIFTVASSATITVTSPNGGENWRLNTTHTIAWNCENVSAVDIDLSADGGGTWSVLMENVPGKSVAWKLSGTVSGNCLLRVGQTGNANVFDVGNASFKMLPEYPANVQISIHHEFADPKMVSSYKIVGLPGNSNTAIKKYMTGSPDVDWISFWDNGNEENYMIRYDGSSVFDFSPGKAFWISSIAPFTVNETFTSVPLIDDSYATIPLHTGWNIISSPFDVTTNWQSVKEINTLESNDIIYKWSGSWNTDSQMKSCEGYYFFNKNNLSNLMIPFEPDNIKSNADDQLNYNNNGVSLRIEDTDANRTNLHMNFDPESNFGLDTRDYFMPPGDFEETGMRIFNPSLSSAYKQLFVDTRPAVGDGQTYPLQLINRTDHILKIKSEVSEYLAFDEVWLVNNRLNVMQDLKRSPNLEIKPSADELEYTVLIGKPSYINRYVNDLWSKTNRLFSLYPNPSNSSITIGYSVNEDSKVRIEIVDNLGRVIEVLTEEHYTQGYYEHHRNVNGLEKGMYMVRMFSISTSGKDSFMDAEQLIVN